MASNSFWVLAFDIERSGATEKYDTIAIGATILSSDYRVLGEYLRTSYSKEDTVFEKRCQDEFWYKNMDILEQLENKEKDLSYHDKQKNMITGFVNFVKSWEIEARKQNVILYRVCDNSPFDVSFINSLIHKFYDNDEVLPLPYEFSTNKYGSLWETHSMMKGILMVLNPIKGHKNWGFAKTLQQMFPFLPPCVVQHDHLPNHDAHAIAHEFIWVLQISACYNKTLSSN